MIRRPIALAALLLVVLTGSVQAHHVPVPAVTSDADAYAVAQTEFWAQHAAVQAALQAYTNALDNGGVSEAQTAGNMVETAMSTTIDHMAVLDVRDCFATWHEAASGVFVALADGFAAKRRAEPSPYLHANIVYTTVVGTDQGAYFASLFDCA